MTLEITIVDREGQQEDAGPFTIEVSDAEADTIRRCAKVPFGDKAAFADEVVRLLSDDAHRASVAPDAAQVAELRSFWDWPNRVAKFRAWVESL